jgi:hypothetical protein
MCSPAEMMIPIAFALTMGINIFGGVYFMEFLARLEQQHKNEWIALGKPEITDDPVNFKGSGVFRYFFNKEYEYLNDQVTVGLGEKARRGLIQGLVSGICLIVLLAFVQPTVASSLGFSCWFN